MEVSEKANIVVKVGSSVIREHDINGHEYLNKDTMQQIGGQLIYLADTDHNVIPVTSAAVARGIQNQNLDVRPDKNTPEGLEELQALSAIGWDLLVTDWREALPNQNIASMQLTRADMEDQSHRKERRRAIRTLYTLLRLRRNVFTFINENDATATDEITFGDNDFLAKDIAFAIKESEDFSDNVKLVLLTDTNGVLEDINDSDSRIKIIDETNIDQYESSVDESASMNSGGMRSKIIVGRLAIAAGMNVWVADGREKNAIQRAINGEIGTHFVAA